jgi:hypothetical protein
MGSFGQPDWDLWLSTGPWGPSVDDSCFLPGIIWLATNVVVGTNPPYYIQDFYAMYPKWAGTPVAIPGATTVAGSSNIALAATQPAGVVPGLPIAGPGVPDGAFILSIAGTGASTVITMTMPATANESNVSLTTWPNPAVPTNVILSYITLASASLVQARWCEMWPLAMGLYVSHYLTLYGYTDSPPGGTYAGQTPYQIALQGYASGIMTSKAAGDLSVGYTPLQGYGLNNWGAFNLTTYGQQLATMAKVVGMGPMFLW